MFPVHPPEERQGGWGQQGVGETCRATSDNSDRKKYMVILVHQNSAATLLLNAALKGSILASNKMHFFKNLKLI